MLFHAQLTPQAANSLLTQLATYSESILLQAGSPPSYQIAYDQVYKLSRNEKQEQVLQTLFGVLAKTLPEVFATIQLQTSSFLEEFSHLIQKTQKSIQKISNICLYLDLNYCKRDNGVALITRLNEVFLSEFFKQTSLVESLSRHLALSHISRSYQSISQALTALKLIDPEQEYFVTHMVKDYLPVMKKHYGQEAEEKFCMHHESKQIQFYIEYASETLQKQGEFLKRFWGENKKCGTNKQFIMREVYEILVTKYKDQIYTSHGNKLFNQLTLQILELFKHNSKSSDIEKHADWYNLQIKESLSKISLQVNSKFLSELCAFYHKIMSLLESTYNKFDIHYRSRFAFEEWVNTEKLQIPLRLNEYIGEYCMGLVEGQDVLERIRVIFVLMKQKNVFEKAYRREIVARMLNNFEYFHLDKEERVVELMEKQCSEEFVKHIKPILASYKSQAAQVNQQSTQVSQASPLFNTLLLNMEHWPYEQKNTSIAINPSLLAFTFPFTQTFNLNNKDKSLYWHPIIGKVTLAISFLQTNWKGELILNTAMANILLHFVKTLYKPFEVKSFCCQTGYKLDQIYEPIRKLITAKLLLNQGTQQNYILALNQSFTHQQKTFDILNLQLGNKFQAKPLEELKADRKFMVEAIIVKIIKKLKHTDKPTLLKQASPLIEKRGFNFNAKFVQSAIQRLIDKEFIRDFEDGKYGYIA